VHADWHEGHRTSPAAGNAQLWDGEGLEGKTVLVHDWPGLGDSLNFVRYVKDLWKLGAMVYLDVRPEAASLLSRVDGVHAVAEPGLERRFDFHVPGATLLLHSMLNHLQAADLRGQSEPYLTSRDDKVEYWASRLDSLARPRIGLSWAGNPGNRNDAIRSLRLAALAPVLAFKQCSFVSLQVGDACNQVNSLAEGKRILDLSSELADLEETAAVIENLDLVVSIDSTVAHLAGGMGKPIWLLRSVGADRRWDVAVNPRHWYGGMAIYATTEPGVWEDAIARVASDLGRL
jgi:hypothetical protein